MAGVVLQRGEQVAATDVLAGLPVLGESDLYDTIAERLGARSAGERAGAVELALEALYLARRVDKDSADGETVYG